MSRFKLWPCHQHIISHLEWTWNQPFHALATKWDKWDLGLSEAGSSKILWSTEVPLLQLWASRLPLLTAPRGAGLGVCFSLFSKCSIEGSGTAPKVNEVLLFYFEKDNIHEKVTYSQIKLIISFVFPPPHSVKRDRKYPKTYFSKLWVDQPSRKLGKNVSRTWLNFLEWERLGGNPSLYPVDHRCDKIA